MRCSLKEKKAAKGGLLIPRRYSFYWVSCAYITNRNIGSPLRTAKAANEPIRVSKVMAHHCHHAKPLSRARGHTGVGRVEASYLSRSSRAISGPTRNPKGPRKSKVKEYHQKSRSRGVMSLRRAVTGSSNRGGGTLIWRRPASRLIPLYTEGSCDWKEGQECGLGHRCNLSYRRGANRGLKDKISAPTMPKAIAVLTHPLLDLFGVFDHDMLLGGHV